MVLDGADATAVGNADRQRHGDAALVAVAQLGHLRDDLVEGRVDEAVELDLAHRAETTDGQSDRRPDDPGLGERRVDDPVGPEVELESLGDAEHAAELADVLTQAERLWGRAPWPVAARR